MLYELLRDGRVLADREDRARQVHATVLAQRKTAPGLIARIGRWVAGFSVTS
jgi:hypothetical protein